jgi:hypothetical protein
VTSLQIFGIAPTDFPAPRIFAIPGADVRRLPCGVSWNLVTVIKNTGLVGDHASVLRPPYTVDESARLSRTWRANVSFGVSRDESPVQRLQCRPIISEGWSPSVIPRSGRPFARRLLRSLRNLLGGMALAKERWMAGRECKKCNGHGQPIATRARRHRYQPARFLSSL